MTPDPGTVRDVVAAVLLLSGATFCLLGAVGMLRFPDTLSLLHAAAKAQTAGLLLVLAGTAVQLPLSYALMLALVALFQLVTVPVTGQVVGRTAYRTGAIDPERLVVDELGERLARERAATSGRDPDGGGAASDADR
ncbi:monovalent cation/H(+) antiporter subunit G [Streptomyces sp. DSM 42041]|uniref:Monovalent cation/H(+) antiporter subunit G n=1 Tax=Streptomyces hazeniae TaxID=3075538 RepID=A0ABU2NMS2_9ACTN|nr:monovalent cation/H(+) antiporter subunit G [Streptomyces sp. DSM 42041]MDT0378284.1 monovalent cation/H(+) antiporter subunit G [Streptomyces sp. DSM 42041]